MYRRYYDGYNTYSRDSKNEPCGEVIIPEKCDCNEKEESKCDDFSPCEKNLCKNGSSLGLEKIFGNLELDDLILIGILIMLLHDGTDDTILLIIVGFLFIVGLK